MLPAFPGDTEGRRRMAVERIEVASRELFAEGAAFGDAGEYERIDGLAYGIAGRLTLPGRRLRRPRYGGGHW